MGARCEVERDCTRGGKLVLACWCATLSARFDPPVWPTGAWLGAELGAAIFVDELELDWGRAGIETGYHPQFSPLIAAALGYDLPGSGPLHVGFVLRSQLLFFERNPDLLPSGNPALALAFAPTLELGLRFAYAR